MSDTISSLNGPFRCIELYVNVEQASIVAPGNPDYPLGDRSSDLPQIFYGETVIFNIHLINGSGSVVPYQSGDTFAACINDDFQHGTGTVLMAFAGNTSINLPGDWQNVSAADGTLSVRMDCTSDSFASRLSSQANLSVWLELRKYSAGLSSCSILLLNRITARNILHVNESAPVAGDPLYYSASQVDSILRAGFELQFTSNPEVASSAHSTQTSADTHYAFRNSATGGTWSGWIALPQGRAGNDGAPGVPGADGEDGANGNRWFSGAGVPVYNASVHNIGDLYLNTSNDAAGDVYQVTVTGDVTGWTLISNIRGAVGPQGVAGTNGTNGINGVDGADGADGVDGAPGADGEDGQFSNGVPPLEFGAVDLVNSVLIRTWAQLDFSGNIPVPVQILDNSGVCREADSRISISWSNTGLSIDFSQIEGGITGIWKLVFGGGVSGSGAYLRSVISGAQTLTSGYWYAVTADCTLTLPSAAPGSYIRISSAGTASQITINAAAGDVIDETFDQTWISSAFGVVELFGTDSGWVTIEASNV